MARPKVKNGIQSCFYLEEDVRDYIAEQAAARGISRSEYITDVIEFLKMGHVEYVGSLEAMKKKYRELEKKYQELEKRYQALAAKQEKPNAAAIAGGKWQKFMAAIDMEKFAGKSWSEAMAAMGVVDVDLKIFWNIWTYPNQERPPRFLISPYAPNWVLRIDMAREGTFAEKGIIMPREEWEKQEHERIERIRAARARHARAAP